MTIWTMFTVKTSMDCRTTPRQRQMTTFDLQYMLFSYGITCSFPALAPPVRMRARAGVGREGPALNGLIASQRGPTGCLPMGHSHGTWAEDLARGVGQRGGKWRRARLFSTELGTRRRHSSGCRPLGVVPRSAQQRPRYALQGSNSWLAGGEVGRGWDVSGRECRAGCGGSVSLRL